MKRPIHSEDSNRQSFMPLQKILLCLDPDPQPSVFDAIVAIDAGVDTVLRHGGVEVKQVRDLVHGALFTRGGKQLCHTALFVGGSDVMASERLVEAAKACFFGPVRVSLLLDPSGANTTAAAAVVAASRHVILGPETTAVVLGATGPVGERVVRLLAMEGVRVRVVSRRLTRASLVCERLAQRATLLTAHAMKPQGMEGLLDGAQLVVAAGAAGVELLASEDLHAARSLAVAIDLNAVPPSGIGGIEPQDQGVLRASLCCYGALGVGRLKMKIHRKAIASLFSTNDLVLDAEEIYTLGKGLG
jgi:hypothetical protein